MADTGTMNIETETHGGDRIMIPSGRVDGSNAVAFQEAILGQIADTEGGIVIDLGNLIYISSAGLRVLLLAAKRLQADGRGYSLCNAQSNVNEVLKVSGFAEILTVHDTREQALATSS